MRRYWFNQGMVFLPLFLVIWTYLTFATSYMIAVFKGDVDPGFPYISDTGARRPESSVFGMMLNISACVALASIYVRYKQVEGYVEDISDANYKLVKYSNKIGLYLGVLICLGLSLVANFQETSVLTVHVIGALMTFVLGTVYEFVHSFITYKMHPEINSRHIFYARITISTLSFIALSGELIISAMHSNGHFAMKFHWNPNDPDFEAHLASTILEWCLAASFLSYFFTFIRDFQQISLDASTHLHQSSLHHDYHRQEDDGESM